MANTIFIQDSVNWVKAFTVQRPTTGVAAIPGEPATTTANLIMQTIVGAPFKWEWNRIYAKTAIATIQGTADYKIALPTFGYLESAVLNNPTAKGQQPPAMGLEVYKVLMLESSQSSPLRIATLLDDNAGNITFRLFPTPDQIYNVDLIYQQAPITIAQGANLSVITWAPIPDKMSYLYQRGFLAQLQGIYNAQLYMAGMEMFFRQLVAAAEGLTEAEKAIFLEDSLRAVKTKAAEIETTQTGKQSRG
jgi:hypothetical protein